MNNTSCIHKVHASVLYSLIEESIYSTKFCGKYFKLQKKLPTLSQSDDEYSIPIYSKWIINIQWHRSYSQHVHTDICELHLVSSPFVYVQFEIGLAVDARLTVCSVCVWWFLLMHYYFYSLYTNIDRDGLTTTNAVDYLCKWLFGAWSLVLFITFIWCCDPSSEKFKTEVKLECMREARTHRVYNFKFVSIAIYVTIYFVFIHMYGIKICYKYFR